METADAQQGTREFIRVLRWLEEFGPAELTAAVQAVLHLPTVTAAVGRVVLVRARQAPAIPLNLESRPHLKAIEVRRPNLRGYGELLGEKEAQP